jgi:hypothetical protein
MLAGETFARMGEISSGPKLPVRVWIRLREQGPFGGGPLESDGLDGVHRPYGRACRFPPSERRFLPIHPSHCAGACRTMQVPVVHG